MGFSLDARRVKPMPSVDLGLSETPLRNPNCIGWCSNTSLVSSMEEQYYGSEILTAIAECATGRSGEKEEGCGKQVLCHRRIRAILALRR